MTKSPCALNHFDMGSTIKMSVNDVDQEVRHDLEKAESEEGRLELEFQLLPLT